MYRFRTLIVVATAVLLLAACQPSASSSSEPPASVEPTAATLASGSFTADLGSWGQEFDIEATGEGDDVSGTMEVSGAEGSWSVDLQCSRTTDDGLLVIAGQVTESTNETFSEGAYVAILFAPGTPVRTVLDLDDEASPADSCTAYLDAMFSRPDFPGPVEEMRPISGDLELGA